MPQRKRTNRDYEIEAVSKALRVLDALENEGGNPVRFGRIVARTGLTSDFVYRALCTLQLNGYAAPAGDAKYLLGKRLIRLASSVANEDVSAEIP